MEAWEALDLEDSDSDSDPPFFLSPCSEKRKKNSHQIPFLRFHPPSQTQTLTPLRIPGPAGAVQAAMLHKTPNDDSDPIPTQEYIRRAVEESSDNHDDFARHPWLFAIDFLRREGLVGGDGVAFGTPLSEIKNGFNLDKVAQVVAIVKSCTPNGLGDLMVTLKDPTGTVDATIHHRVLTEGEFGKDVSVGAVLILHKVAVFSPLRSVRYLNITLANVVKVISNDRGPLLKENYPESTAKHTAHVVETCEKSWMPQKAFFLSQARTKGIMNNLRQISSERSTHNGKEMEEQDVAPVSNSNQHTVGEKETFLVIENVASGRKRLAVETNTTDNDPRFLVVEQPNPWTQTGSVPCSRVAENLVEVYNNQEKVNTNGLLISRGSLPLWTDEQLDELLA